MVFICTLTAYVKNPVWYLFINWGFRWDNRQSNEISLPCQMLWLQIKEKAWNICEIDVGTKITEHQYIIAFIVLRSRGIPHDAKYLLTVRMGYELFANKGQESGLSYCDSRGFNHKFKAEYLVQFWMQLVTRWDTPWSRPWFEDTSHFGIYLTSDDHTCHDTYV